MVVGRWGRPTTSLMDSSAPVVRVRVSSPLSRAPPEPSLPRKKGQGAGVEGEQGEPQPRPKVNTGERGILGPGGGGVEGGKVRRARAVEGDRSDGVVARRCGEAEPGTPSTPHPRFRLRDLER